MVHLSKLTIQIIACEHRDEEGRSVISEMTHLPCQSLVRVYEPLEGYRVKCPKILVVCYGEHSHPIPLPSKTPPTVRAGILKLLQTLDHDLPDLTPRHLLRHSAVSSYLPQHFPDIQEPTLSDVHVSLANKEHLRTFITQAKELYCPLGTGWEGSSYSEFLILR